MLPRAALRTRWTFVGGSVRSVGLPRGPKTNRRNRHILVDTRQLLASVVVRPPIFSCCARQRALSFIQVILARWICRRKKSTLAFVHSFLRCLVDRMA
jgi:hypothetical protein